MLTPYECYAHVALIQVQLLTNMLDHCIDRILKVIEDTHPYPLDQPDRRVGHISEYLYDKLPTEEGLREIKQRVYSYLQKSMTYSKHETQKIAQYFSQMPTAMELNRTGMLFYLFNRIIQSLSEIPLGKIDENLKYEYHFIQLIENIYNMHFNPREFVYIYFRDLTTGAVINALTGGKVSSRADLREYLKEHCPDEDFDSLIGDVCPDHS